MAPIPTTFQVSQQKLCRIQINAKIRKGLSIRLICANLAKPIRCFKVPFPKVQKRSAKIRTNFSRLNFMFKRGLLRPV